MKLKTSIVAVALLMVAVAVKAEIETMTRAYVVSVDLKAKSMTLKQKTNDKWEESVAVWDDKTEWQKVGAQIWEKMPATADLAKKLKKDDKVYVSLVSNPLHEHAGVDSKTLWLKSLCTMPPNATMED
jgi:hypothetical protein